MFKNNFPGMALIVLLVISFTLFVDVALASDAAAGGAGLPWESRLEMLGRSVSGPVASTIALLGLVVCGGTLVWGGDITEFSRRIVYVVLAICILVFARQLLTGSLFAGAVVPDEMIAGLIRGRLS